MSDGSQDDFPMRSSTYETNMLEKLIFSIYMFIILRLRPKIGSLDAIRLVSYLRENDNTDPAVRPRNYEWVALCVV